VIWQVRFVADHGDQAGMGAEAGCELARRVAGAYDDDAMIHAPRRSHAGGRGARGKKGERKNFFFEKKKQKTFTK
jgi:hypothetical protein